MTHTEWLDHGEEYDWKPPTLTTSAFWMLPPMCWLRYLRAAWHVYRWYEEGPGAIGIRTGYDDWVLYGIRKGWL